MLDVLDFIAERGGNPTKIRESQRQRYASEDLVDQIVALYEDHRRTKYDASQLGSAINATQKEIGAKKKAKGDATELLQKKVELEKQKKALEESATEKELAITKTIRSIGNYVHQSVPVSNNEDDNALIRDWAPDGVTVEKRDCLSHHDVMTRLEACDFERGAKVVGHRGNFRTGVGVKLRRALEQYALDFLSDRGYLEVEPPSMMFKKWMSRTAQLEQFDEELYKIMDGEGQNEKYLIATAEQPLSALYAEEWLLEKQLPIKLGGISSCFRKEAGAHGKEAWGLFRTHEFQKVEQFVFTEQDKSWDAFEEMIAVAEEFYKSLRLPFRVVAIVSGALNNAASKKYDLEAWFPFQGEYKELVSCSNCTDYQSRGLEIRCGTKTQTEARKKYAHLLNCTLCATGRALCCIVENYQTEEVLECLSPKCATVADIPVPQGMAVPEVLRPYIRGSPQFLNFTKELPKDATSLKAKSKAMKGTETATPSPAGRRSAPENDMAQLKV
ncbi:MAG: Cytosolic seryl-tRNA synthetase [Piccolia ochrophora]|nr:MAG: Cytosolic seryl-tRNA synthetase [Piccolia ochrophora]